MDSNPGFATHLREGTYASGFPVSSPLQRSGYNDYMVPTEL